MRILTWQGVRGGVGTSSLLAGTATSLAKAGERVLCLDLHPENLLRMHFGHPWSHTSGWATADLEGTSWSHAAFANSDFLHVLPYGRLSDEQQAALDRRLTPTYWTQRLAHLMPNRYDWLLVDTPRTAQPYISSLKQLAHHHLLVTHADPACHLLLEQTRLDEAKGALVVNRFTARSGLQKDILLLWQTRWIRHLTPTLVHQDEALPESLAYKQSVLTYRPESQATLDINQLATWCMAQRRTTELPA